jgi:RNA polymerase sigma factor (TIGR02999 family)
VEAAERTFLPSTLAEAEVLLGQLASQPAAHTLQPTALVHEACLRLTGSERDRWNDRRPFFRAAAQAMRQILVDAARKKSRFKRGGGWRRLDLESIHLAVETDPDGVLAVNEALEDLSSHDPVKADLVKLRFFVGLTLCEAAQALGCSTATAKRSWAFARAWLYRRLHGGSRSEVDRPTGGVSGAGLR